VRADGAAGLALEGSAAGDAVQGSPALFLVDEPEAASAWLDVSLDPGPVGAEILSERGASVFDGPSSRAHVWFTSKDDPYVRIGAVDGAGGAFTLTTRDLASGAATELEPNADALTAEPLGDPGARATLLELATGGADVDVIRIDPTAPAALAILSGAVGAGWWAPRLAVQQIDAGGSSVGAATIAQGAVIALDTGTTSYFAVSAVAGSSGPCLVDARALVAVSEIAPSGAADAFVELESAGGTALDGWSLDLVDANGDVFASVDLAGALVGASGLYVVGAGGAADLVDAAIADLEAAGGVVRVVHAAGTLDDVAWGSVEGAEGASAPVAPDGGSIARPYGIDRDDNAVDFVASSPTPGAPN